MNDCFIDHYLDFLELHTYYMIYNVYYIPIVASPIAAAPPETKQKKRTTTSNASAPPTGGGIIRSMVLETQWSRNATFESWKVGKDC